MKHSIVFIISLLIGISVPVDSIAQTNMSLTAAQEYNIRKWNSKDDLPSNISAMCQTPDGFIWLGNEFGITRFDGMNVSFFNRVNSRVMTEDLCMVLYLSSDSTMYCGMNNGLVLQYKNNEFTALEKKEAFLGKSIQAICEDHAGNLWIAAEGMGLFKFSNGKVTTFNKNNGLPSDQVSAIIRGAGDDLWVGTDGGLCRIKNGQIETYNTRNGLLSDKITALALTNENRIYAGSSDGYVITIEGGQVSEIHSGCLGSGKSISSIVEGKDKKVWIGTLGDGLYNYDPESKITGHFTTSDSLSSNMVTCILSNSEGDLMAGTQGEGLNRLRKNIVRTYTSRDGLAENFTSCIFKTPKNEILIGHKTGGITLYKDGKFVGLSSIFGITGLPIHSITGDASNKIHVATVGSLVTWDGTSKTVFKSNTVLENTLFKSVFIDRSGTLWAGTDAGIIKIRGNEIKTITTKDGLSNGKVFCFLEDHKGRMLAGTREGGINIIEDGKISVIDTKNGLGSNLILCMYEDKEGTIWIGTGDKGLNRIDGKTGKVSLLDTLAPDQPAICQILEDTMSNLWIGTAYGIFVVKKDEINGYVKGLNKLPGIINFREEDGLQGGSVGGVFPAGCVTPHNKLWFSMTEGIAEIDPHEYALRTVSPAVSVISVKVNKQELEKRDTYNIPAGVIYLEINYTAPSFIAPDKLNFRYKLAGYDQDWTEAGDRRFALYTKVPHGDYNFIVEVRDYRGNISPFSAKVKIHVNPYFYQTWWFRILCLLFILGVAYGIFTFRIRQVRDKELEILVLKRTDEIRKLNESLEQQVTERTAQLTATNTELEAFSYSVSHDLKAPVRRIEGLIQALIEDYEPHLDKIALDLLNKINESVDSMNILIEELLKLSRIARQEIEKTEIDLSIIAMEIGDNLRRANPDRKVDLKIQQHMVVKADARLVQIALQNLLDNAWKYTGKMTEAKIEIGMTEKNEKEAIFIRDNGVGFDMGQYGKLFTPFQRLHSDDQFIGTGIGLATVKRIVLKHGGWICAESEPGKGATFFFTLS